ncbi:YqjF family protein [Promicromonospora sp. NPDC050880]|uniref:YqjF family protein n=1 Tax=Promicromonospora sp. NPDC050880 TaxID=3364406 RepID=UPI00379E3B06
MTGPEPRTGMFLTAQWRHLVLLNYAVDPAVLRPLVPHGVELDAWDGTHLVSMVGFRFLGTRLLGVPVPFHRDFDEINLRFYVRRRTADGWRRGVVFVKEIVPRPALAAVARLAYGESYVARPMRHRVDLHDGAITSGGLVEYSWRDAGAWHSVRATTVGAPQPLVDGSHEQFVTEHYWGYAAQRGGGAVEYRVEHPSWQVWQVRDPGLECDVEQVYGAAFADGLAAPPVSAFVADGSPVTVRRGARLPA